MVLPNFLVIGAAKAGTTSLWHYLGQHPDVFMSEVKEPDYFRTDLPTTRGRSKKDLTTTLEDYEKLFKDSSGYSAVGEASPNYLADEHAARRIRETIPDAKLIAILRDPSARAFSEFTFHRMRGKEPVGRFLDAVADDETRPLERRLYYVQHGLYAQGLARFYDTFPAEQIKVVFNDDLRRDAPAVMQGLFSFLGVDPDVKVQTEAELMVSGVPKNKALHWLLGRHNFLKDNLGPLLPEKLRDMARSIKNANLERQKMSPEERAAVGKYFADDLAQLESLLGVDLSRWRV